MKPLKILVLLILVSGLIQISPEEMNTINLHLLQKQMDSQLLTDEDENLFLKALGELSDGAATNEDIEKIIGVDFESVKKVWNSIRLRALHLVVERMEVIKQFYVQQQTIFERIFIDYFEHLRMNLFPETLYLNRRSYVVFCNISEDKFSEIYSKLSEVYKLWRPLKLVMEKRRDEEFKEIKKMVLRKNPNYEPKEFEVGANTLLFGVEPEVADASESHEEFPSQVFGFQTAEMADEGALDNEDTQSIKTLDELKLYSFLSQERQKIEERNLMEAGRGGMLVLMVIGILGIKN